ncbi:ABC transporter permease [Candidatus Nomurabacteria bacterium]|nr:ABC transporter permease [Candidatus Nomurabacteria bacterium]
MAFQEKSRPSAPWHAKGVTFFAFLLLYVPLAILILESFLSIGSGLLGEHSTRSWTLEWYQKVFSNHEVLQALKMSLLVAVFSTLVSIMIGTLAALALERTKFKGIKILDGLTYVPLIMPEIVLGLSLLIWFVFLRLTLGALSMILAHVTFSVSFVVLTVRARLQGFDRTLEEAARDLGATPLQTFLKVTFPLIWPGILSGGLMAFTLSFDDFLITFFTTGVGTDTLPLKIYSMIKFGVSPEIHALSTIMLFVTFLLVMLFFYKTVES